MGGEPVDVDRLVAIGVYDPAHPRAADRLELLADLLARGVTYEKLAQVYDRSGAAGLIEDLLVGSELDGDLVDHFVSRTRLTAVEVAAAAGTGVELVHRVRAAMGLVAHDDEERALPEAFVEDMLAVAFGASMFGEDEVLGLIRVVGAAAARIAEATQALLFGEHAETLLQEEGGELALQRANEQATAALPAIPLAFEHVFYEHMNTVNARMRGARRDSLAMATFDAAVAFVDLVDSTSWTARVEPTVHRLALARFDAMASEVATRRDCRLVKTIGDEAMIAGPDPGDVVDAALDLCAAVGAEASLPAARGAVAWGRVSPRDGDYFGATVNIAARCVRLAPPGAVVVTGPTWARIAASGRAGLDARALGIHDLRGIDRPVEVLAVTRL